MICKWKWRGDGHDHMMFVFVIWYMLLNQLCQYTNTKDSSRKKRNWYDCLSKSINWFLISKKFSVINIALINHLWAGSKYDRNNCLIKVIIRLNNNITWVSHRRFRHRKLHKIYGQNDGLNNGSIYDIESCNKMGQTSLIGGEDRWFTGQIFAPRLTLHWTAHIPYQLLQLLSLCRIYSVEELGSKEIWSNPANKGKRFATWIVYTTGFETIWTSQRLSR